MRRNFNVLGLLAVGVALASCGPATATRTVATATESSATGIVEIHWYTGLGMGSDPGQQKAEQAAVDAFNQTVGKEKNIHLVLDVVSSGLAADTLRARIAKGNGPDIVGPVGWADANAFNDQWLDLDPYLHSTGFDTSVFPPALMNIYETPDATVALPFAVYPSVVFYNIPLFNKLGLAYPPGRYNEGYLMPNGSEVEWTWDALAKLSRLMTVDGAGRNAEDPDFNANDIRQYGFTWEDANHPNYWGAYWAGGSMLDEDSKTSMAPDEWKAAWQWTYDAIWSDQPFMADAPTENSPAFSGGQPFLSGKAAMTALPFRYSCCVGEAEDWDIAALPSYNNRISGRMEEATFRILKGSSHPEEAFTVLQYLVTTAVDTLIIGSDKVPAAFDAVPALISAQEAWKAIRTKEFPWLYNLDVVLDNVNYPDVPSVEKFVPHFDEAWARGAEFADLLRTTAGLDLDLVINAYVADLTAIFSKPESP